MSPFTTDIDDLIPKGDFMHGFKVKATYRFPNGMVATFGYDDKQIPELQGKFSEELYKRIIDRSDEMTSFNWMLPKFQR